MKGVGLNAWAFRAQELLDPLAHLARRLVREGHGEYRRRVHPEAVNQVADAVDDDARFSRARAGEDQGRSLGRRDRQALFLVEAVELGDGSFGHGRVYLRPPIGWDAAAPTSPSRRYAVTTPQYMGYLSSVPGVPSLRRLARNARGFLEHVIRRFLEAQCLLWAGMLTYESLLALVPLVVVMLSVAAAFPVFDRWTGIVEGFIFSNFMPAAGTVAREYLAEFVERARSLSALGVFFLVMSSLLLMFSVDTIVNHIWRVRSRRSLGAKFLVYWAVLTVGPMLIGASIVISLSYATRLQQAVTSSGARVLALRVLPWVISTLAFTLIYTFVPFVRVRWSRALTGGVIAALLFELAKSGFRFYVRQFPAYEAIYGAFAVVPIFLIWTYLSWTVLLLGASFAASLGSYRPPPEPGTPECAEIFLVLRLLRQLWLAQHRGQALSENALLEAEPEIEEHVLDELLDRLARGGWIASEGAEGFRLVRDLARQTLLDLYRTVPLRLPPPDAGGGACFPELEKAFQTIDRALVSTFGRPIESFFEVTATPR